MNDGGPCRIETSPSNYTANQWTGFYMIRTTFMTELRYSSPIIHHTVSCHKTELAFFFYLGFLSRVFSIYRTAGEGEGYLFTYFLTLPPASQT